VGISTTFESGFVITAEVDAVDQSITSETLSDPKPSTISSSTSH